MAAPRPAVQTESPEVARLRSRLHRCDVAVAVIGAAWLASSAAGCLLDGIGRDDMVDYAAVPFIVTSPLLVAAMLAARRGRRLLDLQLRRDLAAQRRSSEAVLTATAPILYPTPAPPSPETKRLQKHHGRYARVGLPVLGVWVLAIILLANDVLPGVSFAVFLVASIALLVMVVKVGSHAALDAAAARDLETHREALKAEAERTPAAPVLYLRSFTDDDRAARRHGALTEEEQLAKALAWVGPLVAVGRPGEVLPQAGAQRIYVADEDWQRRVAQLMSQARLVVLRTGLTEGFRWEVERALTALTPDRLLLVADERRELRAVLAAIARRVGRPETSVRLRGRSIASVKGLVMFGTDWSPQPLRLVRGAFRARDSDEPLVGRFTLALRPLFDRLGVAYSPPGYSAVKVGIVLYVIAMAVIVGLADYIDSLIGPL